MNFHINVRILCTVLSVLQFTLLGQGATTAVNNSTNGSTSVLQVSTEPTTATAKKLVSSAVAKTSLTVTAGYRYDVNGATTEKDNFARWRCYDGSKPSDNHHRECCRTEFRRFSDRWYVGGYYLTSILERLHRWGCEEFHQECKKPTFAFTEYTKLMYDRFCNRSVMESKCTETVREMVQQYGFIQPPHRKKHITEHRWTVLTESLNTSVMYMDDLSVPCIQIALFDRKGGGVGRFHEIVEPYLPFCPLTWAGYDIETTMKRSVSPWTSSSLRCRAGVAVCMVIMAVAGVATVIANATILGVFIMTPKLRNSQAIYKMSLAIADLVVGIMVWPNMIVLQVWMFISPRRMGGIVTPPSMVENDTWVSYFPINDENLTSRYSGGNYGSIVPRPYVNFVGFCTTLGLIVSIYSLMAASFDRFSAVFRPLRYNKHNAKWEAKIVCLVLWIVSIALSILPIFVEDIRYGSISAIFVSSDGPNALVLLLLGFLVPLVITWIITIATFQSSKRHARNRQRIVSSNSTSTSLEMRLARTLALMVGVFSISILPAVLCIVAGFFLTHTLWSRPKDLDVYSAMIYTSSEYIGIMFLTANSLWNCFIYSLRTHGFRHAAFTIYKQLMEKAGIRYIGRGARFVVSSARKVSLSSLYAVRKMSNSSEYDSRKKSVSSLYTSRTGLSSARPSVDYVSSSLGEITASSDNIYSATYEKGGMKAHKTPRTAGAEWRAERKKQNEKDSYGQASFGSFAVDSGADRFFHSVMDNVDERVEEISENPEKTLEETSTEKKRHKETEEEKRNGKLMTDVEKKSEEKEKNLKKKDCAVENAEQRLEEPNEKNVEGKA